MKPEAVFQRYQQLQRYVDWTDADSERVREAGPLVEPDFSGLIDDFYAAIEREPRALSVITGGAAQIERLKGTLRNWLADLFSGQYDSEYVTRRWRVGRRHVEIGLDQVYTNVALSRLRSGLLRIVRERYAAQGVDPFLVEISLVKLLDLDLAVIEDAYQTEYVHRQQRVERMAAIGQVSAGIAHELRNPLNVVKTSVYFLQNARNASPEKTADHLRRIDRQVTLADSVITALSDFARLPLPVLQPVPVEPFLRQVVELVELPGNISISINCASDLPPVLADERQLQIVMNNFLRNACDSMPEGGAVRLAARTAGEHVEISVSDTGVGIEPDNLQRILEPLYSTKSRGIGLGLAIARSILDKHNARLHVESQPGAGSTFTVLLPAVTVQRVRT